MEGARAKLSSAGKSSTEQFLQMAMETSPLRHFKFMREHPNLALAMTPGHTLALLNREVYNQVFGANNKEAAAAPNTISSVVKAKDVAVVVEGALQELQTDIEQCAEHLRSTEVPAERYLTRVATQREQTIFALRNPELCRVAAEFGLDYFEMIPGDQQAVQDCVRERKELAATQPLITAKTAASELKADSPTAPSSTQSDSSREKREARHLKQDVKRTRGQFRYTLHTLEFNDSALEYYCSLSSQDQLPYLSELSRMNRGYLDCKRSISGTNPKVFELEAGKAGRIYYRRHEGATAVLIEQMGSKHTQDSDCADLRNGKS
jgi:hypothetical protein